MTIPACSDTRPGRVVDLELGNEPLIFADLHIHSRYSRATSPLMTVDNLGYWAARKGIGLLGTGDFTHPEYFQTLKTVLELDATGFYRVRGQNHPVLFVPSAETSHIYKQGGKTRRVHMVILARNLETAGEINRALATRGNVASDGRPILGFSARHLCRLVLDIDPQTLVVPAHIWTPWFSVLGERSGFDSLEECFEDELPNLAAVETGLSSDPEMNWRVSALDRLALVSNSDAHSPAKIGRECNAFRAPLTWERLRNTLLSRDREWFHFTVEFFPEEGKYHWPGHSGCKVVVSPERFRELQGRCPVCGRALTGGVASRVDALADRPAGTKPPDSIASVHLVPLDEIIAEALGKKPNAKAVQTLWDRLMVEGGNEMELLMRTPEDRLQELAGVPVANAILRMRRGEVVAEPGYDGVYGRIKIESTAQSSAVADHSQLSLLP